MPIRTFNYTDRKRIRREDARVTIREESGEISFDAVLELGDYELPSDAHVFVEAYRQTQYMRFAFGLVREIVMPVDRALRSFDSAEGVLFRVKVVTGTDPHGLLLAEADQIRPRRSADEDQNRIPLLPVVPDDSMGDELWRLEFDDQQTLLLINSSLGDWRAVARDPVFISLVYPSVFRAVLWRILHIEEYRDTDDPDNWCSMWLRFTVSLPGVSNPPDDSDGDGLDAWIGTGVNAFCRRHNVFTSYENYWIGAKRES